MRTPIVFCTLIFSCSLLFPGRICSATPDSTFFDYLSRKGVVAVTLEVDIDEIFKSRKLAKVEIPADLQVQGSDMHWPVKLSLRGKFRRMNCDFPPLRVEVKKEALRTQGLEVHNDLKLVTHCIQDSAMSKENILKEYLAYKIYQILTPYSYRVQLLEITYVDSRQAKPPMVRYGMLMEDFDELAERLGGIQCDSLGLGVKRVDPAQENLMAVFEYMIGNTDWDHRFLRNIKAVRLNDGADRILIPYDFDYSGLVSAPYARPRRELGQNSLRERIYMGNPVPPATMRATLSHVQQKREEIFQAVRTFELLSRESRNDILNYLRDFYANMDLLRTVAEAKN